jgi:RIO-like serine/threonine protein kinase
MADSRLLKKDLFGEVWLLDTPAGPAIRRDSHTSRWWVGWLARALLRREARALRALQGIAGVPQLLEDDRHQLVRSYLDGVPMHIGKPSHREYFRSASRLLRLLHRNGIAHNDLAKEPNLLIRDDGSAAFIDFQLASHSRRRGRLFRMAAREDIRHLLKHKRTYRPDGLTQRERSILSTPSLASRAYRATIKPVYLFVTRRLLGWADREGAGDRGRQD